MPALYALDPLAPLLSFVFGVLAILITLGVAESQGMHCPPISPAATLRPANIIYPALMLAAAAGFWRAIFAFDAWLAESLLDAKSGLRRGLYWTGTACLIGLVGQAIFPLDWQPPPADSVWFETDSAGSPMQVGSAGQLDADRTPWPRMDGPALKHVFFANVIQLAGLVHVILYSILWNQPAAWRVAKRPQSDIAMGIGIGALKFLISIGVPAVLLAAVWHVPDCGGKVQWAMYFGFLAYFGSIALELFFGERRSPREGLGST